MPTRMDHGLLAKLGHRQARTDELSGALSKSDVEVNARLADRLPREEMREPIQNYSYAEEQPTARHLMPIRHLPATT